MAEFVSDSTKLLPCPFCGRAGPLGGSTLDEGCYVMCRNEDCFGMVGYFENQSEADVAWNTRPAPPALDREAVEKAKARMGVVLDAYDAGLLGDGGGGDVDWWQDYIRAELQRAHEFYSDQVAGGLA